ncbi:hypothetical protein D3C72_1744270 [compost metagenome]
MATHVSNAPAPSKGWTIGLWTVQVLVALMFGMAGFMKSTQPIEALAANMPWVASMPALVRFIGIAELLGAIGMILPAATRILPLLTPAAGGGLATIMVLAAIFHLTRGEFSGIVANVVLGLLAAFVAWGRLKKAPIAPRN